MASLSTLRYVFKWLLVHDNWKDPKYRKLTHPLLSAIFTTIAYIICLSKIDGMQTNQSKVDAGEKTRLISAILFILYFVVVFLVRFAQTGNTVFYEMIWACNMSLISTAYGLIKNRAWMISASMIAVSVDQVLWYIDLLGFILTKKFPVGVANYLTWPTTTKLRIFTSFHHVFFIPICFVFLRQQVNFPFSDWLSSCGLTFSLSCFARMFTPHSIDTLKEIIYLNINLSRELWKDVKIKSLTIFDGSNWYLAIPFGNTIWNIGNFFGYVVLNTIFIGIKMITY